ncbi:hypothetical protein [Halorubrum sp. DTA98]|uniref:hypothetical protein n=1 Tax=Halorubrum sp. DTA98 TaxID=3402163 RepID=UPI003AABBE56
MNWRFRTLVRLFLLLGGAVFFATGVLGGDPFETLIGAAGILLGAVGLASERFGSDD